MTTETKTTWRTMRLGDVADIQWGDTNTTKAAYKPSGYLAFSATGPDGFMDHFDFDRDGVVLSAIGANCGDTWFTNGKWSCIKNTIRFWGEDGKADTRFLYYKTRNKNFWPQRGSAQPFISQTDARNIELEIPANINEQKHIAGVLSAFDEKIENNNRIIKTLEKMAQTIFKEWFVRFRFPGHEKAEFVDSELGRIPKGWEIKTLGELVDIHGGFSYKGDAISRIQTETILVTMGNISQTSRFNFGATRYYNGDYSDKYLLRPGDLAVATRDVTQDRIILGAPLIIPYVYSNKRVLLATNMYAIKNDSQIPNIFFYHLMRTNAYRERIIASAKGSNIVMLTKDSVLEYEIVLPEKSILNQFSALAQLVNNQIESMVEENQKLAAMRDLLLPRLMSGEIRV